MYSANLWLSLTVSAAVLFWLSFTVSAAALIMTNLYCFIRRLNYDYPWLFQPPVPQSPRTPYRLLSATARTWWTTSHWCAVPTTIIPNTCATCAAKPTRRRATCSTTWRASIFPHCSSTSVSIAARRTIRRMRWPFTCRSSIGNSSRLTADCLGGRKSSLHSVTLGKFISSNFFM